MIAFKGQKKVGPRPERAFPPLSYGNVLVIPARGEGVLPYKRLMGICRWIGSHFPDGNDYNGVVFSIELLEWGRTFSDSLG